MSQQYSGSRLPVAGLVAPLQGASQQRIQQHAHRWLHKFHQCTSWLTCSFLMSFIGTPAGSLGVSNIPCKRFSSEFMGSPAGIPAGFLVSSKHTQHIPPLQAACWYSRRVFPWLAALTHYCEPVLSPGYYHTFTNKVWIPFFGSIPPFPVCSLLEYSPSALGWDSLEFPFIFLS